MFSGHCLTSSANYVPYDPGPRQPKTGPKRQPGAKTRVSGCSWVISGSGNQKQGLHPRTVHPELQFEPRSPRCVQIPVFGPNEPSVEFGVGKAAQNGPTWATEGPKCVSHGPKRSTCTFLVIESALDPLGMEHMGVWHQRFGIKGTCDTGLGPARIEPA